jgi:hypothetical protein
MTEELRRRIQQFREEYLDAPIGQDHLATAETEAEGTPRYR